MAAGEGSRMQPITETIPKPLIKICGKTLIEHNIENIHQKFDAIFMIIKYKKEKFQEYFGNNYNNTPIHYIEQINTPGTGAAILSVENKIQWDFIVISGDDLYDSKDIIKLTQQKWLATLCKQVENPKNFGIFQSDTTGKVIKIIEKPDDASYWNLANIGIHKLHSDIFSILKNIPLSPRWELEITDLIDHYIQKWEYKTVEAIWSWITIWYPWDILKAQEHIIGNYRETINKWAIIESNTSINGNIFIESWAIIKSGTYIEWNAYIGKNAIIWPNAYIRGNTGIGENSKIGFAVECKNSYVGENTNIPHLSYIGDSIVGNNVNLWGGTKTANLRHDNNNIAALSKGKIIDTWRRKLGAIIGDFVKTGINTTIYPWRKLDAHTTTIPNEIIK